MLNPFGDPNQDMIDAFDVCNQSNYTAHIIASPFNQIILCPRTLDFVANITQSESSYLRVDSHFGRYIDDGRRLLHTQMWTLLRHLAMLYTLADKGSRAEIYIEDVNQCTHLSSSDALDSGSNWAYYAVSKSMATIFHRFVYMLIALVRYLARLYEFP